MGELFFYIAGGFLFIYLGENLYNFYKFKKLEKENIEMQAKANKKEILRVVKTLDDKIINKRETYEKKKEKVYALIKKRNSDSNNKPDDDKPTDPNAS